MGRATCDAVCVCVCVVVVVCFLKSASAVLFYNHSWQSTQGVWEINSPSQFSLLFKKKYEYCVKGEAKAGLLATVTDRNTNKNKQKRKHKQKMPSFDTSYERSVRHLLNYCAAVQL